MWQLRANASAADARHVAPAERLGVLLVTADRRIAHDLRDLTAVAIECYPQK